MLLGRAAECAQVDCLLTAARAGTSGTLLICGDPGIGKTVLLRYAAERAGRMTVLTARGIEAEADVPFSGLLELLRPILHCLERIPNPQALALRSALALGPAAATDRFIIGAATLSVLAAHAEESPLLVLVDDAQWLDASSAAALVFATRRLLADSVAVILALRMGEAPAIEAAGLPEVVLGGLDREASGALLARHAQAAVPPETVDWLVRTTGGNALALVELATGAPDLRADLLDGLAPVATSVERAFLRRTSDLSRAARRALVLAAAVGSGELSTIAQAAAALGVDTGALQEAERAGLVAIDHAQLEFRHPLVRSAVYHAAPAEERRAAHRALAGVFGRRHDQDRHAWHLAAAAFGPDEPTARALEQAAARAQGRGAYAVAASAFERAARLTPDDGEARARRLLSAADAAWLAGQAQAALGLLDEVLEGCADRRLRADAVHLRGRAAAQIGPVMRGHDLLVEAASQIEAIDPARAVVMLAEAADACVYAWRPGQMLTAAQRAWELAGSDAGEWATACAGLALGTALIYNGDGVAGARLVRETIALINSSRVLGDDPRLLSWAALAPLWLREARIGRALVDRAVEAARARGAVGVLPFAVQIAAIDAAADDRWALSVALHDEAIRLARDTGQMVRLCGALAGLARIEARQGREEACREHASDALALSEQFGLPFYGVWAIGALAELELSLGRLEQARGWLEQKDRLLARLQIADPDLSAAPELVEVHVRALRASAARAIAEDHLGRAREKGQPWALARAERCQGLVADADAMDGPFARAVDFHSRTPDTFELARTRLCYGERLRRVKRRTQAREQLRRAFEAFSELGAAPWAERARLELQATGETARRRDASALEALTPQELRIAMVLAEGRTTREAAAQLFLSPKTIEYHLRSAYRKLGICSRDELARALTSMGGEHAAAAAPSAGPAGV
ncbi:MAG: AAA family ATPase [Acetobacteraceae bacterium]|nr:AAA family ATPase [Acetobacteraceae bacterium]